MSLSADTFQQITESLVSDAPRAGSRDKRTDPRVGVRGRATIIPCPPAGDGRAAEVGVRDVSAVGIGLLHDKAMEAGATFILYLPASARSGGEPRAILYEVARWTPLDEDLFAIGARVVRELPLHGKALDAPAVARRAAA